MLARVIGIRVLNSLDLTYEMDCVSISQDYSEAQKEEASLKCPSGDSRYLHFTQLG